MVIDETILDVDLNALEIEAARQAKLVHKVNEAYADKKAVLRDLEKEIDLTHANLAALIRKKPGKFGLKAGPTETAIKSVILTITKYTKLLDKKNRIQHEIDILKGVANALEHKKRMIEAEVTLHGQNYYAQPYVKNEAWRSMVDDVDKQSFLSKGIKRKNKKKVVKRKKVKRK